MLREIAARLGVQVDTKELVGFMASLNSAKGMLLGFGSALAGSAIVGFIGSQVNAAAALGKTASKMGITTDELQKLQYAMERVGIHAEDAERAIFIFNRTIGQAAISGDSAKFAQLGIAVKDSAGNVRPMLDILPQVADAVSKAGSTAEGTAIATEFFGKSARELYPLLKKGSAGIGELTEEFAKLGGGLDSEVIQNAREVKKEINHVKFVFSNLLNNAISPLLPVLSTLGRGLTHVAVWMNGLAKHTNILQAGMIILGVIGAVKLIPMILSMVSAFMKMRTVLFGVNLPFWLIVLAVTALVLIFEDLYTLITGGDSLIGALIDKFAGVGASAKFVKNLKFYWGLLVDVWDNAKENFQALVLAWEKGDGVLGGLKATIKAVSDAIAYLIKAYEDLGGKKGKQVLTGQAAEDKLNEGKNVGGLGKIIQVLGGTANKDTGIVGGQNGFVDPKDPFGFAKFDSIIAGKGGAPITDNSQKTINVTVNSQATGDQAEAATKAALKETLAHTWHGIPGFGELSK